MKIELSSTAPLEFSTSALVLGCCEDEKDRLFTLSNEALDGCLERLWSDKEFCGKLNSTRMIHTLGKLPAERLLLVGLGTRGELTDERLRQAAGNAVQALRGARIASFASALHLGYSSETGLEVVCEGTLLGGYGFDQYKTRNRDELFCFEGMTLLLPEGIPLG